MTMNAQGRGATRAETDAITEAKTFTGNRALQIEEKLLFEIGREEVTGVDVPEPDKITFRLGGLDPHKPELADLILVASTEVNTDDDRKAYVAALGEI